MSILNNYVNLTSLSDVFSTRDDNVLVSFLELANNTENESFNAKELEDIQFLNYEIINILDPIQKDGYFLNYRPLKGLSEQFDILRFSEDSVLNIEIKGTLPKNGFSDIRNQLLNHRYVLQLLNKKQTILFSYVRESNQLYKLDKEDSLVTTSFDDLINSIDKDFISYNELLDFDLDDLIISPYNQAEEFIKHTYKLNSSQHDVKNKVLLSKEEISVIKGGPGTFKSLLLFDLVNDYKKAGKEVLVLFSAKLNNLSEINKIYDFSIRDSRFLRNIDDPITQTERLKELEEIDIILIDESQRLYDEAYSFLIKMASNKKMVFSVDHNQTMHPSEKKRNIEKKLSLLPNSCVYELGDKVRTNIPTSTFIQKLLHVTKPKLQPMDFPDVKIVYFANQESASQHLEYLIESHEKDKYVSIELSEYMTKSTWNVKRKHINRKSYGTNQIIGQEFENVVVTLDQHFSYNDDGILESDYNEYYPFSEFSSLFQALTRVRKKLIILIYDNPELYNTVQKIKNWNKTV